ncbi:MAG: hypothetical protein HQL92_08225 [Magnetococcales bacterium]|nr:hypothetical protein [Magnetococcales bacterium]
MKDLYKRILGCAAIALMFQGNAMAAEEVNRDEKGKESVESQAVADFAMAQQLVSFGIAQKDPFFLIAAARVMKEIKPQEGKREKSSEGGGDASGIKSEHKYNLTTVDGVLAKAKEMSGERSDLLALIQASVESGSRGVVTGPIVHADRVKSKATDV